MEAVLFVTKVRSIQSHKIRNHYILCDIIALSGEELDSEVKLAVEERLVSDVDTSHGLGKEDLMISEVMVGNEGVALQNIKHALSILKRNNHSLRDDPRAKALVKQAVGFFTDYPEII